MACIQVYGQGYQSPGDGGDIESTLDITDEPKIRNYHPIHD